MKLLRPLLALTVIANLFLPVAAVAEEASASSPKRGLTWRVANPLLQHDGQVVDVGCGHSDKQNECNAYTGDTSCATRLPLMCFKPDSAKKPNKLEIVSQYHQWSGGTVAQGPAISPEKDAIKTLQQADQLCAASFGEGWRVAEHHDGWGWYFVAKNQLPATAWEQKQRYWVDINNQTQGTCWARNATASPEPTKVRRQPKTENSEFSLDRSQGGLESFYVFFGHTKTIENSDCAATVPVERYLPKAKKNGRGPDLNALAAALAAGVKVTERRKRGIEDIPSFISNGKTIQFADVFAGVFQDNQKGVAIVFNQGIKALIDGQGSCQQDTFLEPIRRTFSHHYGRVTFWIAQGNKLLPLER